VLGRAIEAFWQRGYEGTSVADLVAATGLQKGSLYKAFGDKHRLFMKALDRYLDAGLARTRVALEAAPEPLEGLRTWMVGLMGTCGQGGGHRGCMAVNAAVELGPRDDAVRHRVALHFERLERVLEAAIVRGREAGRVRADVDPAIAAVHLVTLVSGLLAAGRGAPCPDRCVRIIDHVIAGLVAG